MRCGRQPVATVSLVYAERAVVVTDLATDRNADALDLCEEHVERMTPPMGWTLRDHRDAARVRA
jgi:hypothetical protein